MHSSACGLRGGHDFTCGPVEDDLTLEASLCIHLAFALMSFRRALDFQEVSASWISIHVPEELTVPPPPSWARTVLGGSARTP